MTGAKPNRACGSAISVSFFNPQIVQSVRWQTFNLRSPFKSGLPPLWSLRSKRPMLFGQNHCSNVAQWKKTLATISDGGRVTWPQFVDFLRVHRVTAEACTCATYCTLGVCEGCLLWLLVKEPGFKVPLRCSWKFVGSRPFKFGRVRRNVVTRVEAPHVRALKSQGGPQKKQAAKRSQESPDSNSDSDSNSSSDGSCDGESLALAPLVKRELDRGSKRWHSMHLYRPPFTCGQCHRKVFLWCVYCEGCMWCLEGEECVARKFKDRDESRWVLQKWEEEVEVGKILHPTQSHAETTPSSPCALTPPSTHPDGDNSLPAITPANASPTSPPLAMEELADHPNAGTETVPPPHALIPPRRHRREWLLRGLFVEMTSWPQCAMP